MNWIQFILGTKPSILYLLIGDWLFALLYIFSFVASIYSSLAGSDENYLSLAFIQFALLSIHSAAVAILSGSIGSFFKAAREAKKHTFTIPSSTLDPAKSTSITSSP